MYWNPVKYKTKRVNRQYGDGINTYFLPFDIKETELTDTLNMCADDYPAVRTRNDRQLTTLPTLSTTPNALGQRANTQVHVLDGNEWKYANVGSTAWTTLSTTLNNQSGKFVEYNVSATRYTILCNASSTPQLNYAYDGSTTLVSLTTNAPHSSLYTVHRRRLFGVENATIYVSNNGDITDWVTEPGIQTATITVTGAKGDITAITTYADHVIVWTLNSMHELYGSNPLEYTLVDITNEIGCVSDRSIIECRGKLYWLDYNGVYLYTGGVPRLISERVKKYIDGIDWSVRTKINAGVFDNKIYFAIPYKSTSINYILVYDTFKDKWFIEDGNFINFVNIQDTLYGQNNSGVIWNMHSTSKTGLDNSTAINYSVETKAYNDFSLDSQIAIKDMWVVHSGTTSATLNVSYSTQVNSTSYTSLVNSTDYTHTVEPYKEQTILPLSDLQSCNWYRLKINGTGHKTIHGVQMNTINYGGE